MRVRPFALLLVLLLAACSQMSPAPLPTLAPAATSLNYQSQFGSSGSGDGQLAFPRGIALDTQGNVYVADTSNERVQVFDDQGTFVTTFGSSGSGDGEFSGLRGVALDAQGNIYTTETGNERVQVFDAQGNFVRTFGSSGSGNGQFLDPFSVAVDAQGNLYVLDAGNNRVQVFDAQGAFIRTFGSGGSNDGQFSYPIGITLDAQSNVYVADTSNNRVQVFDAQGTFVRTFGSGDGQLSGPRGVAADAKGNVYVLDTNNSRVQVFDTQGTFVTTFGSSGSGDGQFADPRGVTVNAKGDVYVADSGNDRVQVFTQDLPPVVPDTYTINLETAPTNKILYSVKVGQGVSYTGTGTANTDVIRVDGFQYKSGKRFGGNQVKVVSLSGDKVLTVVKQGTNTPNPTGGELDIKPAQSFGGPSRGKNGLVTLKSVTVEGVSTNGAKVILYGNGQPIKTLPLAKTESQKLTLDEPGIGFIQVRANDSFTVDDVVFEVTLPK